ncbi:hypothetical protein [Streptomyces sp. XD-27]|uniref:hypothetical protein n=1 Tax=Streptomyces sp. XD-27 TaxID=3062779 RepID=UPI0026F45559|nr:hypothetical protein [Streptomyces sp. XD-27]WKX71356.1 hypothetical protein Q3Y56_16895 [Streptomyces sp. XD-27]
MKHIDVQGIPQFTGNLEQLEKDALAFKTIAGKIRKTGSGIHTGFQGLKAFYEAPEAEQLFASTAPVRDTADDFAGELEWIWSALDSYAIEIKPIVEKLKSLQTQASLFMASVADDDDWDKDDDKVKKHNAIYKGVEAAVAAFQAAEQRAHDKIAMLHGGKTLKEQAEAYQARAGMPDEDEEPPWGSPVERKYNWYHPHNLKVAVWDGFIVDGVWGTINGLLTLIGVHGWDKAGAAWKGLAQLATFIVVPQMAVIPDKYLPQWMRESKRVAVETAKGVVAYDTWKKDPSRAVGVTVFNALTIAAAPAKAGQAAHAASKAAKAVSAIRQGGRLVDPMTYVFKGVSKGLGKIPLPKLSTILGNLDNLIKADGPNPTGVQHALDNAVEMPDKTVRVPINDHEFVYIRKSDGALLDENGQLLRKGAIPKTESSAAERLQGEDHSLARDHELAGVGGRGNELNATNQAGDPPGATGREPSGHAANHSQPQGGHDLPPSREHEAPGRISDDGATGAAEGGTRTGQHGSSGDSGADGAHNGVDGRDGTPANELPSHGGASDGPPDIDPAKYSKDINDSAQAHAGRMEPEQEAGVVAELARAKMDARDQASVLRALRKDPYGAAVAERIARGHLREVEGYGKLLDMCKQGPSKNQKGMVPAAYMAIRLAEDLQARGAGRVGVELDTATFDLDVYTRHPDGSIDYAYQLKDVDTIEGINSAAKKAAKQLAHEGMSHRVAILDVHQPMGSLTPKMFNVAESQARKSGGVFLLRFTDGSITVPPNGRIFP